MEMMYALRKACHLELAALKDACSGYGNARKAGGADLGHIYCKQSKFAASHAAFREALELCTELGHRRGIARTLEGTACLVAASGDTARALTLAAAADHLRNQIGAPLPPAERNKLEGGLSAAREMRDSRKGEAAWEKGLEMPLQAAILFAFEQPPLS
ncbi:MAG TPA: hypothetical protein VGR96_16465 [Acidobacteriaceae bacterium]|nr:hypothetical protein [Acidobacteriaceae bacterium]